MLSRMPYAAALSNASQRLTSKKWQCDPTCTGRSPRLLTSMRSVGRPAFSSMGSAARRYSPGIMLIDTREDGPRFLTTETQRHRERRCSDDSTGAQQRDIRFEMSPCEPTHRRYAGRLRRPSRRIVSSVSLCLCG